MTSDETAIHIIDTLVDRKICFALYRLPFDEIWHLVIQNDEMPTKMTRISQLNGQKGFVMAPFQISAECPLLLIRPDMVFEGKEHMVRVLYPRLNNLPKWKGKEESASSKPNPTDSREHYEQTFQLFHEAVQKRRFSKLVLAQSGTKKLTDHFSPGTVFTRACSRYPRVMNYVVYTPQSGLWIGCTPEVLLTVENHTGHTISLAGTMTASQYAEHPHWSSKNQLEQAFVSDYLRRQLRRYGLTVNEGQTHTIQAGDLVHQRTDFSFSLENTLRIGDLLNLLHPTPAMGGIPKEEACRFIEEYEGIDRKYYSGFLGWIDPKGRTKVFVNLRCMNRCGNDAILYSGGGILPSSDYLSEWKETQYKMGTILNIL